ncbi:MAG: uroporphyrinogen decarboxylase [Gammaproteobacteria bacterium]
MLKNDLLIRALLQKPVERAPIWIMRQAGRYLPEYRKLRAQAGDFMSLCRNPEWASRATMQPLARFDLDAAIIFSDILTIPDAMGLGLYFTEGEGPAFKKPISNEKDIKSLKIPKPEKDLDYVLEAIELTRSKLRDRVPLIGFVGSPWTLATYMIEGGSSKNFLKIKSLMYQNPKILHVLLKKISDALILFLNAQVRAGAQAIMIFDTWGGTLTPETYQTFSLDYMDLIFQNVVRQHEHQTIPRIAFTKQNGAWLERMIKMDCDGIGVDWTCDLNYANKIVKGKKTLQGNLDPAALFGSQKFLSQEIDRILKQMKGRPHVFNLGHGILPKTPIDHVEFLVNKVVGNVTK